MTKEKCASEKYQKISQLEHILKRPDTYIGSVEVQEFQQWIYDEKTDMMIERQVNIVPGLFKIFDEILVNAADNKVRDPSMKKIEVNINSEENLIEVKNDGQGIPIEIHKKEGIYIPEMIFGHLLTSSNYDDNEKKVTGGRNGYGAKLCNIFSSEFILETADPSSGQKYIQKWEKNMSICNSPKIVSYKKGPSYTKISFKPDLQRFHMDILDDDIMGVMRRRVYDINGSVRNISVYLNGKLLKIKNFKSYVELYLRSLEKKREEEAEESLSIGNTSNNMCIYERINDRWEIAFAASETSFQQLSFVNSIATISGGTHVSYISDQIVKKISESFKKKYKKSIKPFQLKNNMFIFINCLIENPAFTSQTKEQLTTRSKDFGSKGEVSNEFIVKIMKTDFATKILEIAERNASKDLKKSDGSKKSRITNYPKLEDANMAGTREGHKCTLVLTEGDSALSLAVAGLAVVGRDYYGCYPLRGKMLNVREATADQIMKNAEIQAIKKIVGLQHNKIYKDTSSLRYGHIMIMTDQDHDGSHIKGLIINFLESSFPGLLHVPEFLLEFITPIVKVTITKPEKRVISFYNMPDYEKWRADESSKYTWKQKYFKGLGTSSPQDAREYFSDLDTHLKKFHALHGNDSQLIELAFSKSRADDRKEWLRLYEPGTVLDPEIKEIPISEFINKELILFSLADNIRSIPSVLDGFKPGQRKVLYGCFKRNLKSEIKVLQLAGYVSEQTGYHHGEQSLVQTIIGLAQSFIGSNNIYLLMPNGAFGTRAVGGKDAAAPRYIFTELNKITKTIFNQLDNPLLDYVQEDEQTVEPNWYLPVIPMILANGAEGIGTGWNTNIPPFNPLDIANNMKKLMNGETPDPMVPWFRGWTGSIEKIDIHRYRMYGKIEQIGENTVEITELPPRTWTSTIKEHLLLGLGGSDKIKPWIKDMQEQHGSTIKFIITLTAEEMEKTRKMGFYERFKLVSTIHLGNMVAFDPHGKIKRYDTVEEILFDFYHVRLEYYQRRKDFMSEKLQLEVEKLSHQARFIKMIIENELLVGNKSHTTLFKELEDLGFPRITTEGKLYYGKLDTYTEELDNIEEENESNVDDIHSSFNIYGSFDYLLGMKIWSLTKEKYEDLLKRKQEKEVELELLLNLSSKDLWNKDLDDFIKQYQSFIEYDEEIRNNIVPDIGGKKTAKRKRKTGDEDYNPKGSKKAKKLPLKQVKLEDKFERILLEQKVIEKTKKPIKIKTETNNIQSILQPIEHNGLGLLTITSETASKGRDTNLCKQNFSLKKNHIEKLDLEGNSDRVDKVQKESFDSDITQSIIFTPTANNNKDDSDDKIIIKRKPNTITKQTSDDKTAQRQNKKIELSDDSDLEILDKPSVNPRTRIRRALVRKTSYKDIDISENSSADGHTGNDSDSSFTDDSS